MLFPDARIIVFAKAPIPGKSKTRLIPALGAEGAADLHARLLRHTLSTATRANLCPVELCCGSDIDHPFFVECAQRFSLTLTQQQGADLGQRMGHALAQALKHARHAILIGTDCPAMRGDDLRLALESLRRGDDCVLKPADDGGYVLVGMNHVDQRVFDNIAWGGELVMQQTRERLRQVGWRWHELATTWDIDRPQDLQRLDESCLTNY